jgi:cellulose synthase operon protein C
MRRPAILWAGMMILAVAIPQLACGQDDVRPEDALSSYRAGRYAEAIDHSRALLEANPQDRGAQTLLVKSLSSIGHYEEAIEAAEGLPVLRGRTLLELGRSAEAEGEFQRAIQEGDPDRLTAELYLAILMFDRGERDEAMRRFDRFIDVYNETENLSAADLTAVGTAVRYLGIREPALFHDAVKAYDEAIALDPNILEPRVLMGEMFIDRYDSPNAHQVFQEVFAINPVHPRALLGLARAKHFDGETAEAFELAEQALEINYQLAGAHVLLARLKLDSENPQEAESEIEKALAVNPNSVEALSVLATIRFLQDDQGGFDQIRDRVLGVNSRYGDLYVTVAEIAAQHRRYAQAAQLARQAVETDPESWTGHATLGLNQLRLGQVEEARTTLERSFEGDPYNAWIKNTLDLLDTFDEYELRTSPRFVYMLHQDEAELLFPYISALAEDSYDRLAERYGYEPETPVRIEVYPRHADFSVRTVGLTGLGALGVAFGNVLALDSPAAREAGQLNWGSTLWHELAHTIALGLSNNRVPRWFTEGLSVLEERRARPGWGSETTPDFMMAYDAGEIPPFSRLNEGFTRPPTPQHLGLAYHAASLALEWIEETHGFPAIVRMLREWGEGRSSAEVLQRVLGAEPESIDAQFDRWLRAKYPARRVEEYRTRVGEAGQLVREGKYAEAERRLASVVSLFDGADPTAQALIGRIRLEQGDTAVAMEALGRVVAIDENAYETNIALAEMAEARGAGPLVVESLERLMYIFPYEIEHHRRLAAAYTEGGRHDMAVRERRAVVALRPVDQAEAFYQLAVALRDAGNRAEARTQVIRALEAAPAFERAQELLLELTGSGT